MGDSLKCVYLIISTIFLLAEHKSFLLQLFSCCYVTVHCQFSKLFIKVYLFFNTQYSHNTFFLESFVYFPFLIVESMCHIGIRKETLKRNKKEKKVQQVQHQLTVISHNKFNKIQVYTIESSSGSCCIYHLSHNRLKQVSLEFAVLTGRNQIFQFDKTNNNLYPIVWHLVWLLFVNHKCLHVLC